MIQVGNRNIDLTRATKEFGCCICTDEIEKGAKYFKVTYNNGGLKGRIYPNRVHIKCFQEYLSRRVNK